MKIEIKVIPARRQRYSTVGDWFFSADGRTLRVRVSQMADRRSEIGVILHELTEALYCEQAGINADVVDAFDLKFNEEGEPGDQPNAPYHVQHVLATRVERIVVEELGLPWAEHDRIVKEADAQRSEK
jgi:hypothetical protein